MSEYSKHSHVKGSGPNTQQRVAGTIDAKFDALELRVKALEDAAAPPDPAPVPPPSSAIIGPGVVSSSKDNRCVGRADDCHYAATWTSQGGTITAVAFNQRTDAPRTPMSGYSYGDGGTYRISVHKDGPAGQELGAIAAYKSRPPGSSGAEDRRAIPFPATVVPAGTLAIVWDNISADPVNNWQSINNLWNDGKEPTPGTTAKAYERRSGGGWTLYADDTPTFEVTFADGHREGQGYGSAIGYTDLDAGGGSSPNCGFKLYGARKVRSRFTIDRPVTEVWLRAKRLSGSGLLYAKIGNVTASASCDSIPISAWTDYGGSRWVRIPIVAPAGATSVEFWTTATLAVLPIRRDGQEQDGWKVPYPPNGVAEKSFDGASWSVMYNSACDLQWLAE